MEERWDARTEALLETEYWLIDVLPRRVSPERGEAYAAAERFFLAPSRLRTLYESFAEVLIRLGCYYDLALYTEEAWTEGLAPEEWWERITSITERGWCCVLLPGEDALITLSGGDLCMTLYHPSAELLDTVRALAGARGLFVWPNRE